jgi:hypothetical protein
MIKTTVAYESEIKVYRSPVKAIRAKCMDCCCDSFAEVTRCDIVRCPLHPFRFGKNPYHSRTSTDNVARAGVALSVDEEDGDDE